MGERLRGEIGKTEKNKIERRERERERCKKIKKDKSDGLMAHVERQ